MLIFDSAATVQRRVILLGKIEPINIPTPRAKKAKASDS